MDPFLRLKARRNDMNQRIAISLGVFVVGFGLGYGATYMLVGSNTETPNEASGPETASRGNSSSVGGAETSETEPVTPVSTGKVSGTVSNEDKGTGGEPTAGGKATDVDNPTSKPVKALGIAEKKMPWWKACLGKLCTVDFGGIKSGLSIRRGSLVHNKKVDWNIRFKKAERLEILPTDRRVKVRLLGVGFDGKGNPAVAHVRWSDRGRKVSGVMSLMPGDKRVSLLANTAE
jgi:hypothetical protein